MSDEALYRQPRVGEGQIPCELDRLNPGAFLLAPFWSLGYRIWPWFIAFLALWLVNVGTALAALAVFGRGHEVVLLRQWVFLLATAVLDAVFALRANRLHWEKEHHRIYSEPSPTAPALVTKYISDQKMWLYFGIGLLGLVSVSALTEIAQGVSSVVQQLGFVVLQLVVLAVAYLLDRVQRRGTGQS